MKNKYYLLLVLIFPLLFVSCQKFSHKNQPQIINGKLDLRNWDFNQKGYVHLNGSWEFYWKHFIKSNDSIPADGFIKVPSNWNNFIYKNRTIDGKGYASYRVKVLLDGTYKDLALKLTDAGTSCTFFVNGKSIGSIGKVGTNKNEYLPSYQSSILEFSTSEKEIEIVAYVSNFDHRTGGLWEAIYLGESKQLYEFRDKNLIAELFLFGGILIMAFYHLGLYFQRRQEFSTLYFSIFCLLMAIRIAVTEEQFIYYFFDINWKVLTHLEYFSLFASVPIFLLFIHEIFKKDLFLKVTGIFVAIGGLFCLVVVFTPVSFFTRSINFFEIYIIVSGLYALFGITIALARKRKSSLLFFLGSLLLFLCVINDILVYNEVLNNILLFSYGMFGFMFFKSFVLATRFAKALHTRERLTDELNYMNKNLEKMVVDRTSEVVRQKEDIEHKNTLLEKQKEELKLQTTRLKGAYFEISNKNLEITQQKNQVLEATQKFRTLFEKSTEPHLFISDTIIDCNQATLTLLKCNDKELLLSKHPLEFAVEKQPDGKLSVEKYPEMMKLAQEKGQHRFEWIQKNLENKEIIVEITLNPVLLNEEPVFLAVWYDLTSRKKVENELKAAHKEVMVANQEIILNSLSLERQKEEIIRQKNEIEEINKDMTASINYASRIQTAVLPPSSFIRQVLPEHFIYYKPRDIISGDFYWIKQVNNRIIVAVADCTGHGVPGAFMSMLGISLLNEITSHRKTLAANRILDELRRKVKNSMRQTGQIGETQDGMDISLIIIDSETLKMEYSGAHLPVCIVRKCLHPNTVEELFEPKLDIPDGDYKTIVKDNLHLFTIKADKMPIGIFVKETPFTNHEIQLHQGDLLYLYSDGFIDQFGGSEKDKFKSQRFKKLLLDISIKPMQEQAERMESTFKAWKGALPQIDDIAVLGIKVNFAKNEYSYDLSHDWTIFTVLIVEDDPLSYMMLEGLLKNTHINVLWAKNGREGVDAVKNTHLIDIILMDISMPMMNGFEAIQRIKQLHPRIPIVIQTAFSASSDKEKGFKAGCDDYITKPINVRELLATMSKYLDR